MNRNAVETEPTKLFTGEYIRLFIMGLAIYLGMNMQSVILPLFAMENLGQNASVTGLLNTVYTLAACVMRPVGSAMADRLRRKTVMMIGCTTFFFSYLFAGLIPVLAFLFIFRMLQGVSYSLASTANNTAAIDVIPPDRLGEGLGYFGMSNSLGSAVGPTIAAFAVAMLGNQYAFLSISVCGLVGLLLTFTIHYEKKSGYASGASKGKFKLRDCFERTAAMAAGVQFVSLFCLVSVMCFATAYLKISRGYGAWVPGYFFAVSAVWLIAQRILFSRFLGKCSYLMFLIPAYLAGILVCLLLPILQQPIFIIVIGGLLYGTANGLVWMAMNYEAVRRAPQHKKGAANATFYLAFDAAIGVGATVWGMIIDAVDYARTYRIAAIGLAVLIVISLILFRNKSD